MSELSDSRSWARGNTGISGLLKPLDSPPTVEDSVYAELRELIISQVIPPGTRLAQRDVATQLGVSQTPVRTALRRLGLEGFVATSSGTATVTPLTREGYEEIMAARLGLESLAARLGAPLVEDRDVAYMRELLVSLERLGEEENARDYFRARWDLHATCYRAAGRPRLLGEVELQLSRSERYSTAIFGSRDRARKSHAFYSEFTSACAERDGHAAEAAVSEGIRWGFDELAVLFPSERELL